LFPHLSADRVMFCTLPSGGVDLVGVGEDSPEEHGVEGTLILVSLFPPFTKFLFVV